MGAESVNAGAENYVSREIAFGHEQRMPDGLLCVVPGIDADLIEGLANNLEVAVITMLRDGVDDDGMNLSLAVLCELALSAANAMRESISRQGVAE